MCASAARDRVDSCFTGDFDLASSLTDPSGIGSDDHEFIQSLAKGLMVIECFGASSPAMTLSEVARKTGLTPGSTRRVLRTLQHLGYAAMEGNRFRLMPRALQLGYAYLSSLPFASLAQPCLHQLTEEMEGSCSVSVLDGFDVVYVARSTARYLRRDYMSVGSRYPAHATSPGKVLLAELSPKEVARRFKGHPLEALTPNTIDSVDRLLAELEKVRAAGWAINDQETALGHRSIAVALRTGEVATAALGIGCDVSRVTVRTLIEDYLPILRRGAATIVNLIAIHEQSGSLPLHPNGG